MTTLTVTRAAELPRVNLLPPEIEEAAKLAKTKKSLVAVIIAVLALLVLGFFWANSKVSSAQQGLDAAQAEGQTLAAQQAQYAQVPAVDAQLATAALNLQTAMAPEVRVSFIMNDLSLTIPSGVRLSSMTIGIGPNDPAVLAATTAATAAGQPAPDLAGSLSYSGVSRSYDAVAAWLNSFNSQAAYTAPYLNTATENAEGTTVDTTYNFTSSAELTGEAKSDRYTVKAGQ